MSVGCIDNFFVGCGNRLVRRLPGEEVESNYRNGKFLDPLSDKILVIAPLLVLIERRQIPAWGVFIIILREMVIAGWRVNPQLKNQQQISGASLWGKIKTVSQITAVSLLLTPLAQLQWTGLVFFWIAVALTIISGIIYLLPKSITEVE